MATVMVTTLLPLKYVKVYVCRIEKHDFFYCCFFFGRIFTIMVNAKPPRNFGFKLTHNNLSTSVYRWHLYLELAAHSRSQRRQFESNKEKRRNDFFSTVFGSLFCIFFGFSFLLLLECIIYFCVKQKRIDV